MSLFKTLYLNFEILYFNSEHFFWVAFYVSMLAYTSKQKVSLNEKKVKIVTIFR